jgi:hypothetical protein
MSAKKENRDLLDVSEEENAVAIYTDKYLNEDGTAMGMEGRVEDEDIQMPRLILLQKMSPQVGDAGLQYGDIIINTKNMVVSPGFIPIIWYYEYFKWNPRETTDPEFNSNYEPGAMIWRTKDPLDPKVKECRFEGLIPGEKPSAVKTLNFICLVDDEDLPVVISFSKTSLPAGRLLMNTLRGFAKRSPWTHKFDLTCEDGKNKTYTYKVLKVTRTGDATEQEADRAFSVYQQFKDQIMNVVVDMSDMESGEDEIKVGETPHFMKD